MMWVISSVFLSYIWSTFGLILSDRSSGTDVGLKLFTSKERALSFLPKRGKRYKRGINEECRETGGCSYEEIEEWMEDRRIHMSVCEWMRQRRCWQASCGTGSYCATVRRDCRNLRYFRVTCLPSPVHGRYTAWSSWTGCSLSCGRGTRTRRRFCTNPAPRHGGRPCSGTSQQTQMCSVRQCPINGGFTSWSSWRACSVTCGNGVKTRSRTCTNPRPEFGGNLCFGNTTQNEPCNASFCPIHGGFTSWGVWTDCSVTCDYGLKHRNRSCSNPAPSHGGNVCEGDTLQRSTCHPGECPVNGGYGEWGLWSSCSRTCGTGITERSRSCDNPEPMYGGRTCDGPDRQELRCSLVPCPVDGGLTSWSEWSACSVSCGEGQSLQERTCTNPTPAYGGQNCTGEIYRYRLCSQSACPVNGRYSEWSDWSQCSKTCGTGVSFRQRVCNNPYPSNGGLNCQGDTIETKDCQEIQCPVNGVFSLWSTWSECSVSCGEGVLKRNRWCSNPEPAYGGLNCTGNMTETSSCVRNPCPVGGNFTKWGQWSHCSRSCGGGTQARHRNCSNPEPMHGGENCTGRFSEVKLCSLNICPVHGNFTLWTSWSECSTSCGGGISTRQRTCTNPEPAYGGENCTGSYSEQEPCSIIACPVDGNFTIWGEWSQCSVSCGGGISTRHRTCTEPEPVHGGQNCSGELMEANACNPDRCPVCASDEFECADGVNCISSSYTCDAVPDCQDGSDELASLCGQESFCAEGLQRCPQGTCVESLTLC